MQDFTITAQSESEYEVDVRTAEGTASITLRLDDLAELTDGALAPDETTARAVVRVLLEHQGVEDLPPLVDIEEVLAAYPEAAERIASHR